MFREGCHAFYIGGLDWRHIKLVITFHVSRGLIGGSIKLLIIFHVCLMLSLLSGLIVG
jgi:hypothetical protein